MAKMIWTDKALALLADLYPTETTPHTAELLGISERAVKNMARQLGISKTTKATHQESIDHVRKHFHEHSIRNMARELGTSRSTVSRIVTLLGLKRTREEISGIQASAHNVMIRREKRRTLFGLNPITRIKVVTNRARIQLRCKLKSLGYIVGKETERNVMYYTDSLERRDVLETNGLKLGLHFRPYPAEESLLTTAI